MPNEIKLEHIALSIGDGVEIKDFYENILGMSLKKEFTLSKDLSEKIFNISKETSVFLLEKEGLILELFLNQEIKTGVYNHICLKVSDREGFVKKVKQKGYEYIHIKREKSDLIFIKDKSGNIFEIK